ncbi:putative DNA-binding protein [Paenibacillus yanchengensis]|uniref:UPF0122 protein ACFSJH_14110 n=1 Tax=Paenibacillus yanchengensis TaxID=2035833 RepID=A0ABW4YMG6_9BACL
MFAEKANLLSKTTRINLLYDFYASLLTDKQRLMLSYYYHDDFSLGEIATELQISRQAVYDNIKRTEQALNNYEQKLGLLAKHEQQVDLLLELERIMKQHSDENAASLQTDHDHLLYTQLQQLVHRYKQVEEEVVKQKN